MAIPLITLIVMLPTIFGTPTDFKKDAGRSYFNGVSPGGVVPYGKASRPVLTSSPCDRKKCSSSVSCCEPEPEFEKYTVPVQPIVAPTVVGYEYAEVSRPVAVEAPKCDRTSCGVSRPCCGERVASVPQQISSFVVPNYNYNYNPYQATGYGYPYSYYGANSNYGYGYPYAYTGAQGFPNFSNVPNTVGSYLPSIGSYSPNSPVPVVEGDAKLNRVNS